jgi:hypothetical protein
MGDGDMNTANESKAGWFAAGALAIAAAIALFLYADGYFDKAKGVELKIDLPKVELEGN